MKRFLSILLMLCLACCLLPMPVHAVSKTYDLDELGMDIDFSEDLVVFTRDIKSNDPSLGEYGLTKDSLTTLMRERNIYLYAWDKDINYEIIITMTDSLFTDYNQFSDTSLNALMPTIASEYESAGITFIKHELYQHTQAKFIKIYISQLSNGNTVYGLQYNTVYDGKAINVTLQSYSGEIDSNKEAILKEVIDSIRFDTAPQLMESPIPTEAFTYTDKESGLSFTVPANWVETPMNEDREYIDVKFTSNFDEAMSIIFSSHDLWDELTGAEKSLYSKSEVDNSRFTKADIAQMFGCKESDVSMVTFSGREYFCAEIETTESVYGFTLSVLITYLVRFENGYMYCFQFFGNQDSEYYSDFERLMNSIEFPTIRSENVALSSGFSAANLVTSLIITILVYSFPIIIYRYAIIKRPVDKKKAKRICVIYGIAAFIVMSIIVTMVNGSGAAGGAIFLWSWINYRMLIGGKDHGSSSFANQQAPMSDSVDTIQSDITTDTIDNMNNVEDTERCLETPSADISETVEAPVETTHENDTANYDCNKKKVNHSPTIVFCHKCGSKLLPNGAFCHKCGAKIPDEAGR